MQDTYEDELIYPVPDEASTTPTTTTTSTTTLTLSALQMDALDAISTPDGGTLCSGNT
jgi:hypothetical protein